MKKYFLAIFVIVISCKKQNNDFSRILSSEKGSMWLMTFPSDSKAYRAYKFYSDGSCTFYLLSKQGKFIKYDWGDDKVSNSWHVHNDTLHINGTDTRIINFDDNKITLLAAKDSVNLSRGYID